MSKYFEALKPELEALEGQRVKTMATIVGLSALIVVASFTFATTVSRPGDLMALLVPLIWSGIGAWGSYTYFRKRFGKTFKAQVITKLVALVDPSLQYRASSGIDPTSFERSRLYAGSFTTYHAEDLVWGQVTDTDFGFCELNVTRGAGKNQVTIFRGLFFEFTLSRPMPVRVTLRPPSGALEKLSRSLEGRHAKLAGDRVAFGDPTFETDFEVISEDHVVTQKLLNAPTRQRLVALRQKVGAPISVAFVDDKCFLGIPQTRDRFEPPIFTSLVDPAPIQDFIETLKFVTEVVRDLNPDAAARRTGG